MESKKAPPLAGARHELIVTELRRVGTVRVRDLAELLTVSAMTVRRDLDELHRQGRIQKVHGGAKLPTADVAPTSSAEPTFAAKDRQQREQKAAIAKAAADLVSPGEAIGLTGGTTTVRIAHQLAGIRDLIVVTNSLRVLDVLQAAPDLNRTLILTGGIPTPSAALVGPVGEQALESLHLDCVFMGVHGMSEHAGFTTPNFMEARTNQAFIAAASRLAVVADSTKWDTVGLSTIAPLDQANVVITDDQIDPSAEAGLRSQVDDVICAPITRPATE